ncbi:putative baseplate assembly protein [Sphingosinicella sp. CPCC 101087]|uniref:putative baseplate assembly protein n=1 Tax=Sphingosinicella sp. CPCC 101087 TaxID=2497754 RepID=UPI00101BCE55|nr:putative baseplate assembly protein [Sphingosinicella sp. CPCC 101087]
MIYFCCDTLRRSATAASSLNGIDFVEIVDLDAPSDALRQRIIQIHLIRDPAPLVFTPANILIEGGVRIRDIRATAVMMAAGGQANVVEVEVDQAGDFSGYRLTLVASAVDPSPPQGFDPQLASVEFSFKAECPSAFDCRPRWICPCPTEETPAIDYLARDYESFRRVMLDRMAATIPNWTERNPSDLGVTLVELLAYAADDLSWRQEDAHTEAFLGRARRRASVRRLARLVDYRMSDGVNARTFVHIGVSADVRPLNPGDPPAVPIGTAFTTRLGGPSATIGADPALLDQASAVFEAMEAVEALFAAHGRMPFYGWSDSRCMLPAGSTRATLAGHFPDLRVGEVLIFEEVVGPRTGNEADADPAKRHPVRLVSVDALDGAAPRTDPVTGAPVTEIEWRAEDALPFALCISTVTDEAFGATTVPEVSVARGNIVLADHGRTVRDEALGLVPAADLAWAGPCGGDPCAPTDLRQIAPRFRPSLRNEPLTQACAIDPAAAATAMLAPSGTILPSRMRLASALGPNVAEWTPRLDLLNSGAFDTHFVAEVEHGGTAYLRFGDDVHGQRPDAGTSFAADYRFGNGKAGNIGRDTLVHVRLDAPEIIVVRNPLAATGGADAETIESVRQRAPFAFRTQERVVTRDDYTKVPLRMGELQASRATWRHTGSWHTIFVTPDRVGGLPVDAEFAGHVRDFLEPYRLAGRDLAVDQPRDVALELELAVCVRPEYFRSGVAVALAERFSNRRLPDGSLSLFHPDRLSFGETVYLSALIAAAQAVPGVASVEAIAFRRLGEPLSDGIAAGQLAFDRLEVPRLDSDPNFPERGEFRLVLRGGK